MIEASPTTAPRKRRRRRWLWAAILSPVWLPLLFYGCIRLAHPNAGPQNIRISKETTHVTGPLAEDGFIDYVAAINAHAHEGVTRENNAAVLLLQALGPPNSESLPEELSDAFYRELGMDMLTQKGDHFVSAEDFAKSNPELLPQPSDDDSSAGLYIGFSKQEKADLQRHLNDASDAGDWDAVNDIFSSARLKAWRSSEQTFQTQCKFAGIVPWRESTYPAVSAWLKQNEQSLELVIEASQRAHFYVPLVGDSPYEPVLSTRLILRAHTVEAFYALSARAMLRVRGGDVESAWDDLLAMHRLARHMARQSTFSDGLRSAHMEAMAISGEAALAGSDRLTPALIKRIRDDLAALGSVPSMADDFDIGERFTLLDTTISLARYGGMGQYNSVNFNEFGMSLDDRWNYVVVNWNDVLIAANALCDKITNVLHMPIGCRRADAAAQLHNEIWKYEPIIRSSRRWGAIAGEFLIGSRRAQKLQAQLFLEHASSAKSAVYLHDLTQTRLELVRLAFAVAAYRAEHSEYPAALSALVPDYISEVPLDPFSDRPYVYRTQANGFVLYSVGHDAKDNNGTTRDEAESEFFLSADGNEMPGYDYVLRVPPRVSCKELGLFD